MLTTARDTLRRQFGFDDFRPGQAEVLQKLLAGRSAAAVFPTGGGKSLCYQLPALLLPGLTLVVSPLIALMKDQIDALRRRGIAAARLDSTLTTEEVADVMQGVRSGKAAVAVRGARAVQQRTLSRRDHARQRSRCLPSTKPTASASGGTTSGPTT